MTINIMIFIVATLIILLSVGLLYRDSKVIKENKLLVNNSDIEITGICNGSIKYLVKISFNVNVNGYREEQEVEVMPINFFNGNKKVVSTRYMYLSNANDSYLKFYELDEDYRYILAEKLIDKMITYDDFYDSIIKRHKETMLDKIWEDNYNFKAIKLNSKILGDE